MNGFDGIVVRGAREHNLKNIDVQIPRNKITVVTGLSGSGKSTLAFDIVYAEGQRRYVDSLSAYARHFLEQLKKPDVDAVTGLSPAVAIDQKSISTNPRSTVGTLTEVYDYLRLLYARVGVPHCPEHHIPVKSQTPSQILESILKKPKGTKFLVLAPVVREKKGEFLKQFQKWAQQGFVRAKVDGKWVELAKARKLSRHHLHNIDILVDRLIVGEKYRERLAKSIDLALNLSQGMVAVESVGSGRLAGSKKSASTRSARSAGSKRSASAGSTGSKKSTGSAKSVEFREQYSIHSACPVCGYSYPSLDPKMFSFNNPLGACETCYGLGVVDGRLSWDTYYDDGLDDDELGSDELRNREREICSDCQGTRLRESARSVLFNKKSITDYTTMPVEELTENLKKISLTGRDQLVAEKIVQQILNRLEYMRRVGASYLSLDRPVSTLSGGEAQRIRLATQLGSPLVGVLYVLDEPSIGLHPRDHEKLLGIIREMCDRGNTILLVEHDEDTILFADHLIDMGPMAGRLGGKVVFKGPLKEMKKKSKSLTGQYLSKKKEIPIPPKRRQGSGTLTMKGAKGNNLKNVTVKIPLGTLCGVTGVSGSGKSTLIIDTLYESLALEFYGGNSHKPKEYKSLEGLENLDKVVEVNQKPIGRTPRSVPVTYVGLFSLIRVLYSQLPESKLRGYSASHFSFNVKGGRCEDCQGAGMKRVEMHFLSDVFVKCDTCQGRRYHSEILSVKFKDKNISDVLNMTINEASEFFRNHKSIYKKIEILQKVGLGYIQLGQSSTTLSGGEAQRIKLSRELSKRSRLRALYILDEPTTGLHFEDVRKLIELLNELVDSKHTVIVIEHNMDVIKSCDYVIDLGPDGGRKGGKVVGSGSPEDLAFCEKSLTGKYLRRWLNL